MFLKYTEKKEKIEKRSKKRGIGNGTFRGFTQANI